MRFTLVGHVEDPLFLEASVDRLLRRAGVSSARGRTDAAAAGDRPALRRHPVLTTAAPHDVEPLELRHDVAERLSLELRQIGAGHEAAEAALSVLLEVPHRKVGLWVGVAGDANGIEIDHQARANVAQDDGPADGFIGGKGKLRVEHAEADLPDDHRSEENT